MASKRVTLILSAASCALAVFLAVQLALVVVMEPVARWVEVEQKGYLWWQEEWMQLFTPTNFVDRGPGRILLCGSSEAREGFLFDVFEAELPPYEVYQNSHHSTSVASFLLVLRYIEEVYGPTAMPDKVVLGVTPWFILNHPPIEGSHHPVAINKYSPCVAVELDHEAPRLVPKGSWASGVSRYRLLLRQPRRYRGALRGVFRYVALDVRPDLAEQYWLRHQLVPSKYHHLPPRPSKQWQIDQLLRVQPPLPSADPSGKEAMIRSEFAAVLDLASRYDMDVYVVNMPQSTWMRDELCGKSFYEDYLRELRIAVGDTPFLDLGHFLADDELYDLVHANLDGSRRVSMRVAEFVRETDDKRRRATNE